VKMPWLVKRTHPEEVDPQTLPAPEPENACEALRNEEATQVTGQEEQTGHTPAPPAKKTGWFTPTRGMVAVASLPSLLSLILMVSTAMDISGGVAGLAAGLFYDAIVVVLVAIAWFQPAVRTLAGRGAWAGAVLASAVIVWHYDSEQMLWAAVPIGAKFAWHLALAALTAQQNVQAKRWALAAEKERVAAEAEQVRKDEDANADDASLTVEQRRTIAALKREAAFAKAKADAEAERERAQIEAENTVDMATDQAEADRLKARYDLAAQVGGRLPIQVLAQFLPDLPGVSTEVTEIHRDRSQINAAPAANGAVEAIPAGFGAGLTEARSGIGGIGVDLGEGAAPQGSNGTGGTGGAARSQPHHAARRASGLATRQRVLAAIEKHGRNISTNRLAGLLGLGRTTVRDHRRALAKAGENVMPDPKK